MTDDYDSDDDTIKNVGTRKCGSGVDPISITRSLRLRGDGRPLANKSLKMQRCEHDCTGEQEKASSVLQRHNDGRG